MVTNDEIKKQTEFCDELSARIYERTRNFDISDYWNNRVCQVSQDIARLRRELLILEKMVGEWE